MARLGPIPAKLQRMELQLEELENEAAQVEQLIESFTRQPHSTNGDPPDEPGAEIDFSALGRRAAQTKLRIEIDGAVIGRPGTTQIISDHKASDSLVRCLALLYEAKGIAILEKLSTLQVSRGPFVSSSPTMDYRNVSKPGELYQFHAIGNSGFHVLTTNTTQEKADNLIKAAKFLGLSRGYLKVEVVEK